MADKNTLKGRSLTSITDISVSQINEIFKLVPQMRKLCESKKFAKTLEGQIIALLFFEPSSRTFSSFSTAVKRLGGQTLEYQDLKVSSMVKGETFQDTVKVFASYADGIVMRHFEVGRPKEASEISGIPVINAGDGPNQHPTQTLLDLYTIRQELGRLENLKIAFVGDPLHYRVFHGQFSALSQYKGNNFYGISPKGLEMPPEYRDENYKDVVIDMKNLDETLSEINPDVISVGRIPKEYMTEDPKKYSFTITKNTLKNVSSKAIIMHPLPRVGEISEDLDSDPRAAYFRQVKNGLYVRMALLSLIFG